MIALDQALATVAAVLADRRLPVVRRPLWEALGQILAEDIPARLDAPPFDRATMDGWAIAAGGERRTYRAAGVVHAGDAAAAAAMLAPDAPLLAADEAVKVMTGAPVPPGTARVVQVELTRARAGVVEIVPEAGPIAALPANIHARGCDQRAGEPAARAGEPLDALRAAALLASGTAEAAVRRRPRVAVAATGDELSAAPEGLRPGDILDTNGPLLRALLEQRGCIARAHRAIPDDAGQTRARVASMLGQADLVVLTGGVSAGDRDLVPDALRSLGLEIHFTRVAVQPGKPTLFATGARGIVFALPGNPVSAFVTFHLYVAPALALLQGAPRRPRFLELPLAAAWRGAPGDRVRLFPAALTEAGGVRVLDYHGSGHLRALLAAEGLVRLEPPWSERAAGAPVAFWPLRIGSYLPAGAEEGPREDGLAAPHSA